MSGTETHLLLAAPGTRVLLVGSGTYAAGSLLPEVDAVPGTVADLGRCLVERAGLDPANLTTLVDPATPMELGAALVEAAEQANPTCSSFTTSATAWSARTASCTSPPRPPST
jgi:hypothetical protein